MRHTRGGPAGPDVTAAVHAGTLQSPLLAPRAVFTLTGRVTIEASAAARVARPQITATSVNRPAVWDGVVISAVRRT